MTMTELAATIRIALRARGTRIAGIDNPVDVLDNETVYKITFGNGLQQSDELYHATRTIGGSGIDDVDLLGALVPAIGDLFNPATEITVAIIEAYESNVGVLTVGASPATPWQAWFQNAADAETIVPGGLLINVSPGAGFSGVGAGFEILRITGAPADKYDLILMGR